MLNHDESKLIACTRILEWANTKAKGGMVDVMQLVEFLINANNHTFDGRTVEYTHVIDSGMDRFYRPVIVLMSNSGRNQDNFDLEAFIARLKADGKFMEYFAKIEARGPHA